MDKVTRVSVADLLINLSAGWIAAAVAILSSLSSLQESFLSNLAFLTGDIILAILCLYIAIKLRRRTKK